MPYTHFRCYGFCIDTVQPYKAPLHLRPDGEIVMRIQALVQAAFFINSQRHNTPGWKETLKILVAPEFFFRPVGNGGAYQFDDTFRMAVQQTFSGFGNAELKDWLIVAGTIISKEPSQAANAWVGRNTAILVRGGQQTWTLIEKQFVSNLDGMDQYIHGRVEASLGNLDVRDYMRRTTPIAVEVDGVMVGLEICLDHYQGVLRSKGTRAHVHVITAGGTPVPKVENVVAPFVFRVDGLYQPEVAPALLWGLSGTQWASVDPQPFHYNNIGNQNFISPLNQDGKVVALAEFPALAVPAL